MPLYKGGYINNGEEILLTGTKKHFYYHNVELDETEKVTHIFGHDEERDL